MEQSSGSKNNRPGTGIPLWLFILLCAVAFLMALAIVFMLLLHFEVIYCAPKSVPAASVTEQAAAEPSGKGTKPKTETTEPAKEAEPAQQMSEPEKGEQPSETKETNEQEDPVSEPVEAPASEPEQAPETEPEKDAEPEPAEAPAAEPTEAPAAEPTEAPAAEPTAAPTEKPTEAPTPKPTRTPKPTATPTPKPTAVPDSFLFGGKKIKTGEKKIDGKKLGINGKNKKLRHITKEEVQDLVNLCPDLEELVLEYCYLDDYAPLGKLTKLKKLYLTYTGAGNGNELTEIGWAEDLTQLRTLSFSHNGITDTEALSNLTKLTYLNMSGNPLTDEDLKPLSSLTNLEKLYLYDLKKITDVSPLSKLSKLTFLHIGHNSKLKSVKSLTSLKKLKYLRLNHTKVSDLSYFGKFGALVKLDLGKCPVDTDTVSHLKECKKLEKIVLEMGDVDTYNAIVDLFTDGWQIQFLYNWSE